MGNVCLLQYALPLFSVLGPVDPIRDIETLNEDQESEYVGDSECGTEFEESRYPDVCQMLDSGGEEYRFNAADSYLRHPNTYLPRYNINSETETEPLNGGLEDSDEEVVPYGFPSKRHVDGLAVPGERSSLLGGGNSNSDVSTNLCDIDDSEFESADAKKYSRRNWLAGVTQTSV